MVRSPSSLPTRAAWLAPLLAVGLTACGASGPEGDPPAAGSSAAAPEGAFPVEVTGDNGEVTIQEQPDAIVSLSATATEMLFAIGAGEQVEAVDDTSDFPAEAPVTDLSAFTPNAEAIAAYEPDLVVISDDINGLLGSLETLGIPTLQLGAAQDLGDSYEQIRVLGEATGHEEEAADLVADIEDRIAAAVASVPEDVEGLSVYHELDPTLYSATSETFIGSVYSLFGLENIADGAADAAGGYPQLSAEYIVGEEPELIVLADTECCAQDAGTLAERPAFDTVPAVTEDRVLAVDDDIASRWGPRIADFAEQVAQTLQK